MQQMAPYTRTSTLRQTPHYGGGPAGSLRGINSHRDQLVGHLRRVHAADLHFVLRHRTTPSQKGMVDTSTHEPCFRQYINQKVAPWGAFFGILFRQGVARMNETNATVRQASGVSTQGLRLKRPCRRLRDSHALCPAAMSFGGRTTRARRPSIAGHLKNASTSHESEPKSLASRETMHGTGHVSWPCG